MPIGFHTDVGYRQYFRDARWATHKYRPGVKKTQAYICVLFFVGRVEFGRQNCKQPVPLLGHPIITLPARTTTAAVASTTWLNEYGSTADGCSLGGGEADARNAPVQRHQHSI